MLSPRRRLRAASTDGSTAMTAGRLPSGDTSDESILYAGWTRVFPFTGASGRKRKKSVQSMAQLSGNSSKPRRSFSVVEKIGKRPGNVALRRDFGRIIQWPERQ